MAKNLTLFKDNTGTVHVTNHTHEAPPPETEPPPEQSKDKILKARFTDRRAGQIEGFCRARRINTSEYLRKLDELDERYFDHIDLLNENADYLIPLLDRLSGRK